MVIPVHFDMETQDPDDVMTLAVLAQHPRARLVGVTLTPGGREQHSLVVHVLRLLGRLDVLVGSGDPDREKPAVSEFHYSWLGRPPVIEGPLRAARHVLMDVVRLHPDAVYLTGGPLKNYGAYAGPRFLRTWVGQGGFAGDSVVPPEHRLPKFAGRETCPSFNPNGAVKAFLDILADPRVTERVLVSKNVCHGVAWDRDFHERVRHLVVTCKATDGLSLVYRGMEKYLQKRPEGKLLHDPLAMCVAIDRSVCSLARVEAYREKGEWGSRVPEMPALGDPDGGANAWITTSVDRERFFSVLTEC